MDQKQKTRDASAHAGGAKNEHERELEFERQKELEKGRPAGGPGGLGQSHAAHAQKPVSEQASHQGGAQIRSDHKPQGPGAGHDAGATRKP